jgi:hypothetical protein
LTDARHTGEKSVFGSHPHLFLQTLFKKANLRGKCCYDRHVGFDCQRHIFRQGHLIDDFGRQALDLIAADPRTLLARRNVLDGENVRGATVIPPFLAAVRSRAG